MKNTRAVVCSCGARYCDLRTGLTFAEVRRSLDRERFPWASRGGVLGYWHEVKVKLWRHIHRRCE